VDGSSATDGIQHAPGAPCARGAAPFTADELRRIELTTAVRATDALPKVPDAGAVVADGGDRVQIMHNGVRVLADAYYGAWMTEIIRRLRGHHEPQEELAFAAVARRIAETEPAPVMVELGSYWAYYSLWMSELAPATRCVCVEPVPAHLEVGRANLRLNGRGATFVHAAVGERHGGTIRLRAESDGIRRRTPVVTVPGLMRDCGLERIDLLLSDIQGAETALLEGIGDLLRDRRIRFLVVSTHHHSVSGDPLTHQRCVEALRRAGAHVLADHTVRESCSGDGLIVAATEAADRDLDVAFPVVRARESLFGDPEYELARAMRPSAYPRRVLGGVVDRLRGRA